MYARGKGRVKRKGVNSTGCAGVGKHLAPKILGGFHTKIFIINSIGQQRRPGCEPLTLSHLHRRNAVDAHIWTQNLRDQDRAIRLLVVFHHGDPRSPDGQAGSVQGVNEIALSSALWLETNACTPRLEGFAVRARRNFAKFGGGGEPERRGASRIGTRSARRPCWKATKRAPSRCASPTAR